MEACCACLHIEYKPVEHDGGLKSDRWVCFDCNREFQRVPPSDRIAALEAQLAASEQARRETVKGIERASAMLYETRHSRDPASATRSVCEILDGLTIANAAAKLDDVVAQLTKRGQ